MHEETQLNRVCYFRCYDMFFASGRSSFRIVFAAVNVVQCGGRKKFPKTSCRLYHHSAKCILLDHHHSTECIFSVTVSCCRMYIFLNIIIVKNIFLEHHDSADCIFLEHHYNADCIFSGSSS